MRIAVCDDNAVFLQFFKSMLANELESRSVKAEIETFTKAESFFYCHGKKPFAAIFLDLDMPEMTGFEVARQLGQNGNCFVIFVTSHQELVYDSFNFRPLNFICKDPDADVMKAVWSLLLIISLYLRALEVLCTGQVCLFLRFAFLVTML